MINLITIGSCTPLEILKTDPNFSSKYDVYYKYTGSISRTYYPPNNIALRLSKDESLLKTKNILVQQQLQAILKQEDLLSKIKNSPKNTVVIIDNAYELWRYYYDGTEMFDICSAYGQIEKYFPQWFRNAVDKNKKYFDEGDIAIARKQYEILQDFTTQLNNLNCPTVLFGNTFTSNVFVKETNNVAKILMLYTKKIPIGRNQTFESDIMAYRYTEKVIKNFYKNTDEGIKPISNNIVKFDIDLEMVYSDPYHPQGLHPGHYHRTCRQFLLPLLENSINEALQKNKKSELILPK